MRDILITHVIYLTILIVGCAICNGFIEIHAVCNLKQICFNNIFLLIYMQHFVDAVCPLK